MTEQYPRAPFPWFGGKSRTATLAVLAWLAAVPAANYTTGAFGFADLPWLGLVPYGTIFAGVVLVARDVVQDETHAWWLIPALITVGGLVSFGVAPPTIAAASVLAFVVSELADWAIYTPLRRHGWVVAAMVSSIIGGAIDSALFLRVAFDSVDGWLPLAIAKTIVVTGTVWSVDRWRK